MLHHLANACSLADEEAAGCCAEIVRCERLELRGRDGRTPDLSVRVGRSQGCSRFGGEYESVRVACDGSSKVSGQDVAYEARGRNVAYLVVFGVGPDQSTAYF